MYTVCLYVRYAREIKEKRASVINGGESRKERERMVKGHCTVQGFYYYCTLFPTPLSLSMKLQDVTKTTLIRTLL